MSKGSSSSSSSASTTHSRSRPRNLVIGATNRPFDVDAALLRRLTVSYHVPLPNFAQRVCILQNMLTMTTTTNGSSSSSSHDYVPIHLWDKTRLPQSEQQQEVNFEQVAMATKGYSPSDLRHLLQTAVVNVMREAKESEGDDDHHHYHRPLTTLDILHAMQSVPATRLSPHYQAAMTQFTSSRRGKNSNMMNSHPEEDED
jgi:SpoVK/Ycf46/Vps4 family AAA+-type ATPase